MEIARIYAIGFLGFLATLLVGHQARRIVAFVYGRWHNACRYAGTHLVLPKLFRGRPFFNPTRSESLCYVLHGISVVVFNAYGVKSLIEAQTRTAQLTVIHLVPLVVCVQLSYIANALGLSLRVVSKMHAAFGSMVALHGLAHACMHLWVRKSSDETVVTGIVVCHLRATARAVRLIYPQGMTAVLALAMLPLVRRFAYEIFLYAHRACSIAMVAALWVHLATRQSFSRFLLRVAMYTLAGTSALRCMDQTLINVGFRHWKIHTTRLTGITESGDTAILRLQLARPCAIRPGQYIYLTILTSRLGSLFQRHPFTVAWWDTTQTERYPSTIYIVIEPRHGWTKALLERLSDVVPSLSPEHNPSDQTTESARAELEFKCCQGVWIDGPYGVTPDLAQFDTFVLFASHGGIFAQLPLVKCLAEKSKTNALAIRKIVLAWEADTPHLMLKRWMESILRDPEVRRDVSRHEPLHLVTLADRSEAARNTYLFPEGCYGAIAR